MIRLATFAGLMLLFPCPFYLLKTGGLLPLPVIVAYGTAGGGTLAVALLHLVVYTIIFYKLARWVAREAGHGESNRGFVTVLVIAALLALSFAPIYGSGDNVPWRVKLKRTAWDVYRDAHGGRSWWRAPRI